MATGLQTISPGTNQWGTVTFQIPEQLKSFQDNVNTVAEFLVSVLDIALTALEFVKTFLVGFLDPIAAIVQAIITEVEALVTDMRQLGIYITGDWGLLQWPYPELKGGFQEYQRRMISRLTDLTDPTRPDVSANTKVLAMFFYLSADVSEIERLIMFVRSLLKFFNQSVAPQGSLPVPVPGTVQYGADAIDILHPKSIPEAFSKNPTPPSLAKIRWGMSSTAQRSPFNPIPPLPPGGFIVSVSTVADGLKVVFDAPQSNTSLQPSVSDPTTVIQPREYGQVRIHDAGTPLVLFGGSDMLPVANLAIDGSPATYNDSLQTQGATRIYTQLDKGGDGIIPLDNLRQPDGKQLLQRVFYVPSTEKWASWAAGEYGFVLAAQDLPYTCAWQRGPDGKITPVPESITQATTAYVRIAAITKSAYDKQAKYIFLSPNARGGRPFVETALDSLGSDDLGAWSHPVRVAFPGGNTQAYLDALKTALLVLVLSRPDLKLYDPSAYPLEVQQGITDGKIIHPHEVFANCGLEGMAQLADMVMSNYQTAIQAHGGKPGDFRAILSKAIEKTAHNIYNTTGQNNQIEKIVADQTQYLRSVTWGKILVAAKVVTPIGFNANYKLLDGLSTMNTDNGLAMNPFCLGIDEGIVKDWFYVDGVIQNRKPMMEIRVGGKDLSMPGTYQVNTDAVPTFMKTLNKGQQRFYERFIQPDGSILVPTEFQSLSATLGERVSIHGSADLSPVFYLGGSKLQQITSTMTGYTAEDNGSIHYCRGLFTKADNGQVFQEATTALSLAAAAIRRSSKDSAWIALRVFDIVPGMDDFFAVLSNWMKAVQASLKSIVDTIKRYIEFIEGRLVELQALIRRINSLLQNLLGLAFQIPKCSFLTVISDGTTGIVGGLTNAKTKPNDSPLAYGAGLAVVVPFGPALAMDLIQALIVAEAGTPGSNDTLAAAPSTATAAIGIEGLPSPVTPVDPPPDVL